MTRETRLIKKEVFRVILILSSITGGATGLEKLDKELLTLQDGYYMDSLNEVALSTGPETLECPSSNVITTRYKCNIKGEWMDCTRKHCCSDYTFIAGRCVHKDQDPCSMNLCEQQCTVYLQRVICTCFDGFKFNANNQKQGIKPVCEDINECLDGNGDCEQECINEMGTYRCACRESFRLRADNRTCETTNPLEGLEQPAHRDKCYASCETVVRLHDKLKSLQEKVNIVFHCAASMSMDAKLKAAIDTNVKGLNELIDLCQEINNLKAVVFVSTAYSNCIYPVIEEKFYDVPIQAETLLKIADDVHENTLNNITSGLLGNWPNTYCFTKAIAENLINRKAKELPAALFRPSIVMPTYEDPISGWTSNVYGPVGIMLAGGLGLLRIVNTSKELRCDLVPVDFCVNALICAARDVTLKREKDEKNLQTPQIEIYNFSKGFKNGLTWEKFSEYSLQYEYPLKDAIWPTMIYQTNSKLLYYILWFVLHTIPGYLIDVCLYLSGNKPRIMKAYQKIWKFSEVIAFFSLREFDIVNNNIATLWNNLNKKDQKLFAFNMDNLCYKQYIINSCTGVKLYILKEDLNNIEQEKRRYKRLVMLHKVVKYFLIICGIAIAWQILKRFEV